MLIGHYESQLDLIKGRTAMPAKFRKIIGRTAILTPGYEGSLMIIPRDSWNRVTKDIVNRPLVAEPAREIDRYLLGNAFEIELDHQGRFILPPVLKKMMVVEKTVVFVGMGNRLEMWGRSAWEKQTAYLNQNIKRISKALV